MDPRLDPLLKGSLLKQEPEEGRALAGLWRYRVGDFRIVCDLVGVDVISLPLGLGRCSKIYL